MEEKDIKHQPDDADQMRRYYTPELERFIELTNWEDYHNPYFHLSPLKLFPGNYSEHENESDGW